MHSSAGEEADVFTIIAIGSLHVCDLQIHRVALRRRALA